MADFQHAYEQGYQHAQDGKSIDYNPWRNYPASHKPLMSSWELGWNAYQEGGEELN